MAGQLGALADIAVAGFRLGRRDAEGHEVAGGSRTRGGVDRLVEGVAVPDDVVGRQQEQQGVRVLFGNDQGRDGGGGGGVAANRLQSDGERRHGDLAQLFGDDEAVLVVADHQLGREALAYDAAHRVLEHGPFTDQRQKLLRVALARNRPEARTRPTGEENGMNGLGSIHWRHDLCSSVSERHNAVKVRGFQRFFG